MDEADPYHIDIDDEPPSGQAGSTKLVDHDRIRAAITAALRRHGCKQADIHVALVDDDRIAALNEQYLNHTGPTDVLSFDLSDGEHCVEGQLVVSLDTAEREAAIRGHSIAAEVLLYCIHGTLHLLGMNDDAPDAAAEMHRCEDELLQGLGEGTVFSGAPR